MATTDTEVQNLIVNKLTLDQYMTAKGSESLSATEAYEITDIDTALVRRLSTSAATGGTSQGVYVDANGQVQTCDAVTSTYSGTGTAPVNGTAVKSAIDAAIASVYKPAGSVAFANLPSPVKALLGNVYDVTDAFTTDSKFVNSGQNYPAGTNVVVINTSGSTYKYDVLPGFIDLSPYQLSETAVTHTKNTAAGSATQPVYIASDGTATATTYALNKTVPADAVFTDTTYSAFTGADGTSAGTAGLVPAPAASDNTKFLSGDGTWTTVNALPSQTSQSGKFLTTDGTTASWANVDALPSQTGNSGKYLTTNGTTASWGDTVTTTVRGLKTINGTSILGTGDITVDSLPSQAGNSGKYLTTNGTAASWGDTITTTESPLKTINGNSILGTGDITITSAPDLDETTINLNSDDELQAIGVIEKNTGAVKYDWVGTLAQWTAGRSGGTIPDSWICYITDDETTGVSVNPDNKSITTNSSDQIQSIGVINQNNTTSAIKTWTGTLAQYNALKEQPSYYAWVDNYDALFFTTSLTPSVGDTVYFGINKEDTGYFKVYSFNSGNLVVENVGASYFPVTRDSSQDETGQASQIDNNTLYNITDDTQAITYEAYSKSETYNKNEINSLVANNLSTLLTNLYPVGSIYIGTQSTCPIAILISGSTWIKVSEGRVLQGSDSNHNAGTTIEAGLPNITGSAGYTVRLTSASGAFDYGSGGSANQWGSGEWGAVNPFTFNASRSSSIYGNSNTVQPPAFVVNIWQRTA